MQFVSALMGKLTEYRELKGALAHLGFPAAATGLSHIHKAVLIKSLCEELDRRALIIAADEAEASRFCDDLTALGVNAVYYPSRDYTFRDIAGFSREYEHMRLGALQKIASGNYTVCVASAVAACQLTLPKDELCAHTFTVKNGQELPLDEILARLVASGYIRADMVEGVGQFAVRGGILDLFPPQMKNPVRIEFWGDSVDSVSLFDKESQRRTEVLDEVIIPPACEVIFADRFVKEVEEFASKLTKKSELAKEKLGLATLAAR
ncbi:MAG: transcription-repair coupling factor, partial [Clostridia bacterium]|nr:transcription-repair coupling factor [Clostridia bacterium]